MENPPRDERGAALIISLMAVLLLLTLGSVLAVTTAVETRVAGNYAAAQETLYAAEAAIERALLDLVTVSDWTTVLNGSRTSTFTDGPANGSRNLPDGSVLNIAEATYMANCGKKTACTDAELDAVTEDRPWGENNPRWTPYAYGSLNALAPTGIDSPAYVIVWVGDDQSENDNDPTKDGDAETNPGSGVMALRAEAFGVSGSRRMIEVTVARTIHVRSWREMR